MPAKLARKPYAFGITAWGPLPDTADMHVQWDGPGSGLYLYPCEPSRATMPGQRIRHASASGTYATMREAERAVHAFAAAGEEQETSAPASEPTRAPERITFANDRTAAVVDTARRACQSGAYERSLALLADADGLEAWAGVNAGTGTRERIAVTIKAVRARQQAPAMRERAAESLAAELGDDVSEWTA